MLIVIGGTLVLWPTWGPFWILHVLLVSHPANRLVKQEKIDGYIFNMYSLSVL